MAQPPEGHSRQLRHWNEIVQRYGSMTRANLVGGHQTDLEVAFNIAMLLRDQPNHEAMLEIARDRIRWLSVQLAFALEGADGG